MKGVSTVIATLLMLIITIALAGFAYSYISGIFGTKTGKIVGIDSAASFFSGTAITVALNNDGTIDFTTPNVFITVQGGGPVPCDVVGAVQTVEAAGATVVCG